MSEDQVRAIWEADQEAYKDHAGASPPTVEDYEGFLAFPHRDPTLWKVAWDGDEVAGQVKSYIDPDENTEFGRQAVATPRRSRPARAWRRRGVSPGPDRSEPARVGRPGMEEAALSVHTENPNGAFQLVRVDGLRGSPHVQGPQEADGARSRSTLTGSRESSTPLFGC